MGPPPLFHASKPKKTFWVPKQLFFCLEWARTKNCLSPKKVVVPPTLFPSLSAAKNEISSLHMCINLSNMKKELFISGARSFFLLSATQTHSKPIDASKVYRVLLAAQSHIIVFQHLTPKQMRTHGKQLCDTNIGFLSGWSSTGTEQVLFQLIEWDPVHTHIDRERERDR